jgi:hypothetical protein
MSRPTSTTALRLDAVPAAVQVCVTSTQMAMSMSMTILARHEVTAG